MTEVQKKQTLGTAIASLICGCFFLIPILGWLSGLAAIVCGIIALMKISGNKETLRGKGLAVAGIIMGGIGFIIIPVFLVLASLIIPLFIADSKANSVTGRIFVAQADIEGNIESALALYELDHGTFPLTEEGLDALMSAPASSLGWNGPYLPSEPVDPWGREYVYRFPGNHGMGYDVYSLGPDGVESDDDVTNWQ